MHTVRSKVIAVAAVLLSACGGAGASSNTGVDASSAASSSSPPTPLARGTGSVTVDIGTFPLDVQECGPTDGDGPIVVAATTTDGRYEFSVGGIGGVATITLAEFGVDRVWTAVGATPTMTNDSLSYTGPALKTTEIGDPATTISVSIQC